MLEWLRNRRQGRRSGAATVLRLPASQLTDLVCPESLTPATARRAWAQRVLAHYHGDAAAAWPLLVWSGFGAQVVTAWRGGNAAHSTQLAQGRSERLVRIEPTWPLLLQALLASRSALRRAESGRALLLETGDQGTAVLTQLTLCKGRLQTLQRRRLEAPWTEHLLAQHREAGAGPVVAAWVLGTGAAAALQTLLAAGVDAQGQDSLPAAVRPAHAPDFTRPDPRPGALAWAALAVGGLMLAGTSWAAAQAWQQRAAAMAVATPAVLPATARLAPVDSPSPTVALRLNHPWREVFLAAERPAIAGLNWLVLEHQAGADLRLQGVARAPELVQRAATALRMQAPWRHVLVARLDSEGEQLVFELTARGPGLAP